VRFSTAGNAGARGAAVDPDVAVSAEQEAGDERLRDDILDLLTAVLPIRDLQVEVVRGRVTLDGVVPDRSMQGIAEDLTTRVPGVVEVVPRLSVEPS
jgi:osmotically-inducible protein OsmY